jgi:hypothetical protein
VGLIAGSTALTLLIVDRLTARGKSLAKLDNKIDGLCDRIDDMDGRLTAVDGLAKTVGELVYEWRGVDGENGYKSIIRNDHRRIDAIEKRNNIIDALKQAHDDDIRRSGGQQRRQSDREINNLLPEDREEKA